jgi:hypothetical protein
MLKPNSMQPQTSNYDEKGGGEFYLKRPNPPTPEMVARAQPFRADVVQMDAAIKHPTYQVVE